jgi:methylaspartate ammonia-lyase
MIRMDDLTSLYSQHANLPEAKQVQAGKAIPGTMGDDHTEFVQLIAKMIKDKTIDVHQPETFLHKDVFDALDEISRSKVEQAMVNIADQLRHVADFYLSKETPDSAPQLQTMIEHLWQMKDRVEKEFGDVFIF